MTSPIMSNRLIHYLIFAVLGATLLTACSASLATPSSAKVDGSGSGANSTNNASLSQSASTPGATGNVSFSKDISPIFQAACVKCHGGEKTSKGLDLKTFDSLMVGSQNGAVVVAGDPAGSKLIQSVESGKMPKNGPQLSPD